LKYPSGDTYYRKKNLVGEGRLIHKLILRNISDKGFAMFYGDESSKHMVIYDLAGKQTANKTIKDKGDEFAMLTSGNEVYLLIKDTYVNSSEGDYNMLAYRTSDSTVLPKYALKDKKGNA